MMSLHPRAATVAVLALLAASSEPQAQQTRDVSVVATGSTTVTGTVVADDTGQPMARVLVTLTGFAPVFARVASTDTEGRFAFPAVRQGDVTITAAKTAYLTAYYGARDPIRGPAVPLTLSNNTPTVIALRLVRGAVIAGTITGPTGRPRPGLRVSALRTRVVDGTRRSVGGPQGEGGVTDDGGRYRIWGLSPGEFVVQATPEDQSDVRAVSDTDLTAPRSAAAAAGQMVRYAPVYYPGTTDASEAAPVTLAAAGERDGIDVALRMIPTASLRGTLLDVDGQPAAHVSVALNTSDRRVTTDSDDAGRFTFGAVAPGTVVLSARTGRRQADPSALGERWATQELIVNGQDQKGVVLNLRPGMTASGRVTFLGPPAPGTWRAALALTVSENPAGSAMPAQAEARADGTFTIAGLAPGRYRLHAAIAAPSGSAGGWFLRSVLSHGQDLLDGTLDVAPGQDVSELSVVFSDRQTDLSGTLSDSAGRPVAGFDVVVFAADRRFWTPESRRIAHVLLGRNGRFVFAGLPPGDYLLAAVTHVEADDLDDPAWLDAVAALAVHTTLVDGEHKVQDIRIGHSS
jgi:hypothetical protein